VFHTGHRRGQRVARLVDFVWPGVARQVVDIPGVVVASARRCSGLVDMAELLAAALVELEQATENFVLAMSQCLDLLSTGSYH